MSSLDDIDSQLLEPSLFTLPPEIFLLCCTAFDQVNILSAYHQNPSQQRRHVIERLSGNKLSQDTFGLWEGSRLQSFLTFKDWTSFDCAITNKRLRNTYLLNIKDIPIAFPIKIASVESAWAWTSFNAWFSSRNLRLVSVILSMPIINQLNPVLLQPFSFILRATIHTPAKENYHLVTNLIGKMRNVTFLDFTNNQRLTTSGLKTILKNCRGIEILSLSQCKYINDSSIGRIAQYGKLLRKLDISKCSITPKALMTMLPILELLVSLNISSCRFSLRSISDFLRLRPTLEEFQMNNLEYSYVNKALEQTELNALAASFNNRGQSFIILSLNGLKALSDSQLFTIIFGCKKLRKLCLESCAQLTDASIRNIGLCCPSLVALDIRNCGHISDKGIEHIHHDLKHCEDLAVDGCYQLTSDSVATIEKMRREMMYGHQLRFTCSHCPKIESTMP